MRPRAEALWREDKAEARWGPPGVAQPARQRGRVDVLESQVERH